MTIFVDPLVAWPMRAATAQARRIFGEGKESCHLVTDGPLAELHAFAARIGMRRSWFQDHARLPHYDLTPKRRAVAIAAGAHECTRAELVALMRKQPWLAAPGTEVA